MTTIELPPLNFADHPDCIAGIVWTPMELAAIRKYATAAIEQDRARFWPEEVRRSSDRMAQARQELERCEMAIRAA